MIGDYSEEEQEEIGFQLLESQLSSTLMEFKRLGKMHHAMLLMAKMVAPDWCDISVFMTSRNPEELSDYDS